jgi:hypothetical protein
VSRRARDSQKRHRWGHGCDDRARTVARGLRGVRPLLTFLGPRAGRTAAVRPREECKAVVIGSLILAQTPLGDRNARASSALRVSLAARRHRRIPRRVAYTAPGDGRRRRADRRASFARRSRNVRVTPVPRQRLDCEDRRRRAARAGRRPPLPPVDGFLTENVRRTLAGLRPVEPRRALPRPGGPPADPDSSPSVADARPTGAARRPAIPVFRSLPRAPVPSRAPRGTPDFAVAGERRSAARTGPTPLTPVLHERASSSHPA